jgi:hypothetical protein
MSAIEPLADVVTGGLIGRAVEPRTGEVAPDGHTEERNCLNCGCALVGDYCHCCGQQAHVHRTVGAWWHDFLHSVLHLDGKFWRTLPMLAIHPGELTRRYIAGERAKFVSPLALFLFSVFLMFAVMSLLGGPLDTTSETSAQDVAEAQRDIAAERAATQRNLAALQRELESARTAGLPTADIERRIQAAQTELAIRERAYGAAIRLANGAEQNAGTSATPNESETRIRIEDTGWAPLDRAIQKAERNPSLLLYKLQANAYKFSWALIPISLPFLWVLFLHRGRYRRDFGAYDHLVFITYSIAFMSLGAITLSLLRPLGISESLLGAAMVIVPPVHIYRQLRGAYDLSRVSALWRTVVLLNFSFLTMGLFLMLLLAVGVLG